MSVEFPTPEAAAAFCEKNGESVRLTDGGILGAATLSTRRSCVILVTVIINATKCVPTLPQSRFEREIILAYNITLI